MGAQYYIEKADYENQILRVRGWIFYGEDCNAVKKPQIVIRSLSGIERKCDLELIERQDVSEIYNLKYSNVGFKFNSIIKSFVSAKVYFEYFIAEEKQTIEIMDIQGTQEDVLLEQCQIEYPEISGYYNIKNLKKVSSPAFEWKKTAGKKVDVIIPIYNGFEYLHKLFISLYHTNIEMRVIAINDCSPDQRVDRFMESLCAKKNNITYIKNAVNLGFVKSVNKGLELAKNDVVLVNTDVEVPDQWLERLMYPIFADESVATTTPYTNCGTICSFPELGKDNAIFDNRSLYFVDSVFKNIAPNYTEMPTGVGFCMGMSLTAIKKVGLLDENNFDKGYCEENDWCQRAIKHGYKNVQVENLFVYHKHGGSFQSDKKRQLIEQNTQRLLKKHPDYMRDAAIYFENDVNKAYRKYALLLCLCQIQVPTSLFFNHTLGGGANDYLLAKKKEILEKNQKFIEMAYDVYSNHYHMQINYKGYELKLYGDDFAELMNKIELSNIDMIFVNELVTYPDIYLLLDFILKLKKVTNAKLTMLAHDYFSVCPTINLMGNGGFYCGMLCNEKEDCLKSNAYICDSRYHSIKDWRSNWGRFLAECDSVIVFSNDSRNILEKAYGELKNIKVIPHITNKMLEVHKKFKMSDKINIGILGVLSDRKGLKIVKEMLERINQDKLPVNIVVIGTSEEDISGENCIITGRYTREQLPRLMYLYDIDVIFIASVWPETFSYTTEEAMKMKMPVAAFHLGAPAERVRKYNKGIIIDSLDAGCALDKILETVQKRELKMAKEAKVLFVIDFESFASRYRVEHLREHLAYIGIASELLFAKDVNLEEICKYTVVSIYRCTDVQKIQKIAEATKKAGIKLIFDVDDLVFDYKKIAYLEFLQTEEYKDFDEYCANVGKCMELCDVLTTSTKTLADEIKLTFPNKKVIVCRNAACLEMQLLSEIAIENDTKEITDKVVLGYFSGSHTHNRDWLLIEESVIRVMEDNRNVELLLVGALQVSKKILSMGGRVQQVPFVDWRLLPKLLRSIDINLMPLENELFHQCKSENKWMEAGLVGVPTIASYNAELENVMEDGTNVIFCKTQEDWYQSIGSLVNDEQLRTRIGDNALKEIYKTHLVTSDLNYKEILEEITGKKDCV